MNSEHIRLLNETFVEKVASGDVSDIVRLARVYVRKELREKAIASQIIPPVDVTPTTEGVQRDARSKRFYFLRELEPLVRTAMPVSFTGDAVAAPVNGPVVEYYFGAVESQKFYTTEDIVAFYQMPITKLLQDQSINEIRRHVDRTWISSLLQACLDTGQWAATIPNSSIGVLSPKKLVDKATLTDGEKLMRRGTNQSLNLIATRLVINVDIWNDFLGMPTTEGGLGAKHTLGGIEGRELLGWETIETGRVDVLPSHICMFVPDAEFMGDFLVLDQARVYLTKKEEEISWKVKVILAGGLANINSVCAVDLQNYKVMNTAPTPNKYSLAKLTDTQALSAGVTTQPVGFASGQEWLDDTPSESVTAAW